MDGDHRKKGPLDSMSPTQTFGIGFVGGILILCTIGFFILLSVVLGGVDDVDYKAEVAQPTAGVDAEGQVQPEIRVMPVDEKRDNVRGNKKAKITIIEYSDTECPFCKVLHKTMVQLVDKYGDKVRFVYRHFPLDGLHRKARTEAIATECAGEQGKFWEYIDLLYEETNSNDSLDLAKLPEFAERVGISRSKFEKCLNEEATADKVIEDENDAMAAGGRGTPYSVLVTPDGELVPLSGARPFSAFESAINEYLD